MNTPNNKRRRDSQNRIVAAFIQALQTQELSQISVTQLCQAAKVNRTTFYANYQDIYGLADTVQQRLENGCQESPEEIQQIIASEYGPKRIR